MHADCCNNYQYLDFIDISLNPSLINFDQIPYYLNFNSKIIGHRHIPLLKFTHF